MCCETSGDRLPSFADAKVHPVEWLVEEIIPRRTVTLITAPTGIGKSTLSLHLALCILTGRPWLGFSCKQGPVAYWDQDNPDNELTDNRLCAIALGMGIAIPSEPRSWLFRTKERIDKWREPLLERIKEMGAIVLFVDTFAAINPYNENDNTLMSQIVVDCFFPIVEAGASVILLHHPAKEILLATPRQLKAYQRTGANASRGSSGLPAACGTVFNLTQDDQKRISLVNQKPRYGRPPTVTLIYDEDGEMGDPAWKITLKPSRPHATVDSALNFVRDLIPERRVNLTSRQLVAMMIDSGYYMTQSTAARALKLAESESTRNPI
jgi:hypothetical protein